MSGPLLSRKGLVAMAIFVTAALGIAMPSIPSLVDELKGGVLMLGAIGAVRSAIYLILCQFTGRLSDRIGRKRTIVAAMSIAMISFGMIPFLPTPRSILMVSPLLEFGSAMFWPPIIAWIGDSYRGGSLRSTSSIFNVAWSAAAAGGAFLGGNLYEMHRALPFLVCVVLAFMTIVVGLRERSPNSTKKSTADSAAPATTRTSFRERYPLRLIGAWTGNFSIGIAGALTIYIFRKLGSELGQSPGFHGFLLFAYGVPRTLIFLIGCKYNRWIHNVHHILWAQALGCVALLLMYHASTKPLFTLAFAMMGTSAGIILSVSLYTLLSTDGERGKKSGIHEGFFGGGFCLGALMGGILAHFFELRTPFLVFAGFNALLIVVQAFLFRADGKTTESAGESKDA